jgi:hypothetical protein
LLILAAGPIAQRIAYRRSRDGAGSDHRQAALLGATMCHAAAGQAALQRHAKEEAASLVRQNWSLICELAEAFDAGLIPGRRVKALTADFDLRTPLPPALASDDSSPPEPRRPSRRDLQAAALLAAVARAASGDQQTLILFERALEAGALRRGFALEAARSKVAELVSAKAARLAWRPVPSGVTCEDRIASPADRETSPRSPSTTSGTDPTASNAPEPHRTTGLQGCAAT